MSTETVATIHKFEKAGLGKAPFKIVGFSSTEDRAADNTYRMNNGLTYTTNLCGGTCEYCGKAIFNVFTVQSSDGNKFKVGCDCVRHTGDSGLIKVVDKQIKDYQREQRHAKEAAKIAEGTQYITANMEKLATFAHPSPYFAEQGKTFVDYVEFMLKNSGNSGKLKTIKQVRELLK